MAEAGPVFEIEVNVEGDRAVAGRPMVLNVSGKGRRRSSDTRGGKQLANFVLARKYCLLDLRNISGLAKYTNLS